MKVEINNRRKSKRSTNRWKLNSTLLNNQWVKEEVKREIKGYLKTQSSTKEPRIYNGEKTVSSASGVGKAGQLHVKE